MIRTLKPGAKVPDGTPARYINVHGYYRLRWKIGSRQYVEVYEHRVFDGYVTMAEHVHHKNGVKTDNRRENLEQLSKAEHMAEHAPPYADDVVRRYLAGETTTAIAADYDLCSGNVWRILNTRGISCRPRGWHRAEADRDVVAALHAEGVRVSAMAKRLGINREAINRALDEMGLPRFRPGRPEVLSQTEREEAA